MRSTTRDGVRRLVATAATVLLIASACGGGGEDTPASLAPAPQATDATEALAPTEPEAPPAAPDAPAAPPEVSLLTHGYQYLTEIRLDELILARAWKDGAFWNTGKMHALKGLHDRQRHECRSDALGRLVTLAMMKQHTAS